MHRLIGVVGVGLVEVLGLGEKVLVMIGYAGIIHHHREHVGLDLLDAQLHIDMAGKIDQRLGREVHALGPIVFLTGKARPVEESGLHMDGHSHVELEAGHRSHIAHIAHLLGNETTIGEILLMGRAVGIDGKRYAHLPDGEVERVPW